LSDQLKISSRLCRLPLTAPFDRHVELVERLSVESVALSDQLSALQVQFDNLHVRTMKYRDPAPSLLTSAKHALSIQYSLLIDLQKRISNLKI
jgi:hypothetical protein